VRTGAEYREALRDGRRVWVLGEGLVEDVTVHPSTRTTVDEYVAWYGSALDGRESAFELHANGGVPAWRGRMRRYFARYSELANAVLRSLSLDMPKLDLESLRAAPLAPRRPVTPPR